MTVEHIAHMSWNVSTLASGERMYVNTTEGITGVAVIRNSGDFSYVVVVEDETSPRHVYDNAEYASWNSSNVWGILENLAQSMYHIEQDMAEESYDDLYEIDDRYDDYDYGYDNDSDLYNEH